MTLKGNVMENGIIGKCGRIMMNRTVENVTTVWFFEFFISEPYNSVKSLHCVLDGK